MSKIMHIFLLIRENERIFCYLRIKNSQCSDVSVNRTQHTHEQKLKQVFVQFRIWIQLGIAVLNSKSNIRTRKKMYIQSLLLFRLLLINSTKLVSSMEFVDFFILINHYFLMICFLIKNDIQIARNVTYHLNELVVYR